MDNVVIYRIFLRNDLSPKIDINREQSKYLAFLSPLIGDYIWQKDSFCVGIKSGSRDVPDHLYGETNFGDNIDDEWFIVYLLFELTKAFPQTCIRITDNDGELLLIEAAHSLPKWLSPDTSKNRVFVCNGEVHIIPIPSNPAEVTVYPTGIPMVHQALQVVFGPHRTVAEERVQRAIRKRIQGYRFPPDSKKQRSHHAHCLLPAEVKYILDVKPSLISPVVQAFCDRDPIDMKACRTVNEYPLKTRVMTRIRFTRCLYAQLSQQPFKTDRRSEWKVPGTSDPLYKAHELGLKLACGVQILCGRSRRSCRHQEESQAVEEQDCDGAKWKSFLHFLKEQNYFRGEVEGSKLYQDLLSRAKRQFSEDFAVDISAKSTPGDVIIGILNDAMIDVDKMEEEELLPEDDDSWLNLTPEDLDKILTEYGNPSMIHDISERDEAKKRGKNTEIPVDLESVTRSMKSFVDNVSSYVGAEFPGECDDDEDIQFNAHSFMDAVGNLLEYRNGNDEDSESDEEHLSGGSPEGETDSELNGGVEKNAGSDDGDEMASYMDQMDWELARTSLGQSFEKEGNLPVEPSGQNTSSETAKAGASAKDNGETAAVDVDFNLVKNILESLSTQQGLAGPASNILGSMGVWLPSNADSS